MSLHNSRLVESVQSLLSLPLRSAATLYILHVAKSMAAPANSLASASFEKSLKIWDYMTSVAR